MVSREIKHVRLERNHGLEGQYRMIKKIWIFMSKIFVTGAGGFLGGYIIEELNRRGHEVFGLVRKHNKYFF